MVTRIVRGIKWQYHYYNEKVAFGLLNHTIVYLPYTGYYHLKELGETIFADRSAEVCLMNAPEYIWEYYAAQFKPSWEQP
jgi:hypothetical protein